MTTQNDSPVGMENLSRCIAIVTLLHEKGILKQLLESNTITVGEIDERVNFIREHFKGEFKEKEK